MPYLLLIASLLIISTCINAQHYNVPCPKVPTIQSAAVKLNAAQKVSGKYMAYTRSAAFQAYDLWWFVGVGDLSAYSPEEAIEQGKSVLKQRSIPINVLAKNIGNEFVCIYGPGYIQARGKTHS